MATAKSILAALAEQVDCYRRLARLAAIQHEYVQQSQTEALLDVLNKRQDVLNRIGALERQVGPARRQWGAFIADLDESAREGAEALLKESRALLEEITSADRDDAMVLQQRKLNIGRQIGQATAARHVNRSYAATAYAAPARVGTDVRR